MAIGGDALFQRRVVEPATQTKDMPEFPLLFRGGLDLYLNVLRTVCGSIGVYSA